MNLISCWIVRKSVNALYLGFNQFVIVSKQQYIQLSAIVDIKSNQIIKCYQKRFQIDILTGITVNVIRFFSTKSLGL